ncbi:MAG: hypothetical protein M3430_11000 [Acidobacteriota bacterium]|nr:hypothetical protein [Acidobacteriota bacterium]
MSHKLILSENSFLRVIKFENAPRPEAYTNIMGEKREREAFLRTRAAQQSSVCGWGKTDERKLRVLRPSKRTD